MSPSPEHGDLSRSSSPEPQVDDVKGGKKKLGRPSGFNDNQSSLIESKFDEFETLLVEHHLQYGHSSGKSTPAAVKDWLEKTINELMKDVAFRDLDKSKKSEKDWRESIRVKFKNRRYSSVANKHTKALIEDHLEKLKREHEGGWMEAGKAFDVLTSLQGGLPKPKTLFVEEERANIEKLAAELLQIEPSNNGGSAFKSASAQLWAQADQGKYEQKVNDLLGPEHKYKNRKSFIAGIHTALTTIARSGVIGDMEMCLLLGARDEEDEPWACSVEISSEPDSQKFLKDDPTTIRADLHAKWEQFIDQKILPSNTEPVLDARISNNKSGGIPQLAGLEFGQVTRDDVVEILDNFLHVLWYKTFCTKEIPWADVAKDPASYYDVEVYPLSFPASPPRELSYTQLYTLLDFFTALDSAKPFVFKAPSTNPDGSDNGKPQTPVAVGEQDPPRGDDSANPSGGTEGSPVTPESPMTPLPKEYPGNEHNETPSPQGGEASPLRLPKKGSAPDPRGGTTKQKGLGKGKNGTSRTDGTESRLTKNVVKRKQQEDGPSDSKRQKKTDQDAQPKRALPKGYAVDTGGTRTGSLDQEIIFDVNETRQTRSGKKK
ncbi:hypothetical protein PQX77_015110 [Marasmius sp. AFHP31]|nr:hypothetical protein PQX77_022174 [Marasmius sp. AFHP31]KAK1222079.1 hypothetical protein PQX77_015110 [Marasmius sp. AFHP31]